MTRSSPYDAHRPHVRNTVRDYQSSAKAAGEQLILRYGETRAYVKPDGSFYAPRQDGTLNRIVAEMMVNKAGTSSKEQRRKLLGTVRRLRAMGE